MRKVFKWLCANYLGPNVDKSCFTVNTNKSIDVIPVLENNNINLPFSSETKSLGIIIGNMLTFAKHISIMCCKTLSKIGLLEKWKNILHLTIIKKPYYNIVHPHMIYGIKVWG